MAMRKMVIMMAAAIVGISAGAAESLQLEATTHTLGGNVRGFGVLAEYPAGGPDQVTITRSTVPGKAVPLRDFPALTGRAEPLPDFCLLKVSDPTGKTVAVGDLGDQSAAEKSYTVKVPAGPAGIWRFSVCNGRNNDRYRISLPSTAIWGIRGEMALGLTPSLPPSMYLYLPETTRMLIVESFGGARNVPVVAYDGKELGRPKEQNRRNFVIINQPPAGKVVTVDLKGCAGQAIAFDGAPGLLCPTPEAAMKLRGGTVKAAGLLTAGPLQARAREQAVKMTPADFDITLKFPSSVPADLSNPRLECLFYGKYGNLNSFAAAAAAQITDPASPWYGANVAPDKRDKLVDWQTGLHGSVLSPFDASGLAAVAVTPGKMNPAYLKQGVINRAVISAFYHLASLQGDDLMREGDFQRNSYPMTHAFFVYDGALARPLALLRDRLDPQTRQIWAEGLMAVGDKITDFTAYESNQWSHVISGHLGTFIATGEPRFLGYFEKLMNAYLDNTYGPASKFGQHPAGFFLEEYGPDGNYDHLNMYSLVSCYYHYRELPQANKTLVEKMRRGIEKNLYFKSFYWLPQPSGEPMCPNAMNCRTNSLLCYPSYPGDYMTAPEFDLGYTRYMLTPIPAKGSFPASVFPHLTTTDEWARRLLNEMVPRGDRAYQLTNFSGSWTADLYDAWKLPQQAKKVKLPFEAEHGVWELPGQIAWKDGSLYGLVFYDVAGSKGELKGITGGAPSVLWSKGTGSVFCSMRNTKLNKVDTPDDLTWACVYGKNPQKKLVWSGKEHGSMQWEKKGEVFAVEASLSQGKGSLRWQYRIMPNKLELTVILKSSDIVDPVLNLPVLVKEQGVYLQGPEKGKFHFILGKGFMRVRYPETLAATLTPELKSSNAPVRCLRLPFPADGKLTITVDAGIY